MKNKQMTTKELHLRFVGCCKHCNFPPVEHLHVMTPEGTELRCRDTVFEQYPRVYERAD